MVTILPSTFCRWPYLASRAERQRENPSVHLDYSLPFIHVQVTRFKTRKHYSKKTYRIFFLSFFSLTLTLTYFLLVKLYIIFWNIRNTIKIIWHKEHNLKKSQFEVLKLSLYFILRMFNVLYIISVSKMSPVFVAHSEVLSKA